MDNAWNINDEDVEGAQSALENLQIGDGVHEEPVNTQFLKSQEDG